MKVEKATYKEHAEISAIAKLSKFTKGFASGGLRFVEEYYAKGWVLTARERGKLLGFVCVRNCVIRSKPFTNIYYIGAAEKRKGVGTALLRAALKQSPWEELQLISEKENEDGLKFYRKLGFKNIGEGQNKAGIPYWRLSRKGKTL